MPLKTWRVILLMINQLSKRNPSELCLIYICHKVKNVFLTLMSGTWYCDGMVLPSYDGMVVSVEGILGTITRYHPITISKSQDIISISSYVHTTSCEVMECKALAIPSYLPGKVPSPTPTNTY